MLLSRHLSQAVLGFDLSRVLFEASERLLQQLLGVVRDDNGLVGVYGALLIELLRTASALLGLLYLLK